MTRRVERTDVLEASAVMCEPGNTITLHVPIRVGQWEEREVDECLAPFVEMLNSAGVWTSSSCCGHGEDPATVLLHDGSALIGDPMGWMMRHPPPDAGARDLLSGERNLLPSAPMPMAASTWIDISVPAVSVG